MTDNIPPRDVGFAQWIANFNSMLSARGAALDTAAAEQTAFQTMPSDWSVRFWLIGAMLAALALATVKLR